MSSEINGIAGNRGTDHNLMEAPNSLNILYFGIYSKGVEYPRNNNLIGGLRANNIPVTEAHFELAGSFRQRIRIVQNPIAAIRFIIRLLASYAVLARKFSKAPGMNAVIVGHPGYFHIHLAGLLRNIFKKDALLVYDVFIPLYDALVEDRGLIKPGSRFAKFLRRFERSCCRMADMCLIDTLAHCRYLIENYGLPRKRVQRIFVGPTIRNTFDAFPVLSGKTFNVLYFGTYIPLHGVEVILEAARKLKCEPEIRFLFVGSGQLRSEMESLASRWKLQNVVFQDWVPTDRIAALIRSCHLSLGIFGSTPKTGRVIPSKIFDICAAGVPFITADTPAVKEAFIHGENAWFVPPNNSRALADAILILKSDPDLREKIAFGAYQTGKKNFSLEKIGNSLINVIQKELEASPVK